MLAKSPNFIKKQKTKQKKKKKTKIQKKPMSPEKLAGMSASPGGGGRSATSPRWRPASSMSLNARTYRFSSLFFFFFIF